MHVWLILLWKEWLELRWKLAALTAVPLAILVVVVLQVPDLVLTTLASALGGYTAVATLFLAMSVSADEQADGTLEFVRGLPVERWKLGVVRITGYAYSRLEKLKNIVHMS